MHRLEGFTQSLREKEPTVQMFQDPETLDLPPFQIHANHQMLFVRNCVHACRPSIKTTLRLSQRGEIN